MAATPPDQIPGLSQQPAPPPGAAPKWKAARLVSYNLNPGSSIGASTVIGGPPIGTPACAIVFKADKNNSVDVLIGGGLPTFPLAPSETQVLDIPRGWVMDLGEISASGNGSTGQIVHIHAVVLAP